MSDEETKRGPGRPPKAALIDPPARPDTVRMRVLRDYWPGEDERVRAGSIIEMGLMDALDALARGTVEKAED